MCLCVSVCVCAYVYLCMGVGVSVCVCVCGWVGRWVRESGPQSFFYLQFWILAFSLLLCYIDAKTEPGRDSGNMKNGFMQMSHNP